MSTISIPEEVARRLDIERVSITTRLFSESGTYCRRQKVEILIGVGRSQFIMANGVTLSTTMIFPFYHDFQVLFRFTIACLI